MNTTPIQNTKKVERDPVFQAVVQIFLSPPNVPDIVQASARLISLNLMGLLTKLLIPLSVLLLLRLAKQAQAHVASYRHVPNDEVCPS